MNGKKLTQKQINKIIKVRVNREKERLGNDFENRLKRCMASIHLMLHTEIKDMRREMVISDILEENCNDA